MGFGDELVNKIFSFWEYIVHSLFITKTKIYSDCVCNV